MANLMNDVYHGCLCNVSSLELISFKKILLKCINDKNSVLLIYHPLNLENTSEEVDEVQCNNLIFLQILTEEIYLKPAESENVCSETLQLLSSLYKDMKLYNELKKLLAGENTFIQYTVSKLLSSIVLSIPEIVSTIVTDLSNELKKKLSESTKIAIITFFQKIICFSRFTPDQFQGPKEVIKESPQTLRRCENKTKQPYLDIVDIQSLVCETLVKVLPILLQDHPYFFLCFGSNELYWLLKKVEEVSFNKGLLDISVELHQVPVKEIPVIEPRLLFSILHLWQSFAEFVNENSFSQKNDILQCENKWNWANLLRIVFHSSTSVSVLLLNILNHSLSYQGKTEKIQNSLPSCVFMAAQFGCLSFIPVTSSSWGFSGLIECTHENMASRFCGNPVLQKFILLLLKSLAILKDNVKPEIDSWTNVLDALFAKLEFCQKDWINYLFSEQDDNLIEAMLCCFDVYFALPDFLQKYYYSFLNPHQIFESFVRSIKFDHQVILDFLTSNETCFLFYLIRYLKYFKFSVFHNQVLHEPQMHVVTYSFTIPELAERTRRLVEYSDSETEEELLERFSGNFELPCGMTEIDGIHLLCSKLRLSIAKLHEKELFPYNPQPLLKLLESCCEVFQQVLIY